MRLASKGGMSKESPVGLEAGSGSEQSMLDPNYPPSSPHIHTNPHNTHRGYAHMSALRRLLRPRNVTGVCVVAYAYDYHFNYQRFHRNIRSLVGAVATVYDYKVVWQRTTTLEEQSVIHDRVAKRWFDICSQNGGLYVKVCSAQLLAPCLPLICCRMLFNYYKRQQ
jgi:hypothetical protein